MTEESLPTLGDADTRVRFIADGVVTSHIPGIIDRTLAAATALFGRRHPSYHEEPDYERVLREREGQVEVRIEGGYHEKPSGGHSWKDWILGIAAVLIAVWLGRISLQMDDLVKVGVKQEGDEKQIAELRCTVYKVCR
jgi:hypothetical protein